MKPWTVVVACATISVSAQAQVGYPPAESPFRDLPFRQEATIVAGYFAAGKDPVGVAPQSGPLVGVRYEARIGGPAATRRSGCGSATTGARSSASWWR